MKTNSLAILPRILSESTLTAHKRDTNAGKGIIKLMPAPPPPDEATIQKLNEIAGMHPFCILHRVKKHETL